MPLLSLMEFAEYRLHVSYRAAKEPQILDVSVSVEAEPFATYAPWAITTLVDVCNRGAGAGNRFAPTEPRMRILSGPVTEQAALAVGLHYAWRLEVASVAPEFIRLMVEELRRCGFDQRVASMDIRGSLPLDKTDASITETVVRGWLDRPDVYPGAGKPPFRVGPGANTPDRHDAAIRVEMFDPIRGPVLEQLEELSVLWLNAVRNYVSPEGKEIAFDVNRMLPRCACGGREFRALFPDFGYNARAADVLVNMLARFHTLNAPIVSAEISV